MAKTVFHLQERPLTEEVLSGLVGKCVHATTNIHRQEQTVHNVWFAGVIGGYQKEVLGYDYGNGCFLEPARESYSVVLTDGAGYLLSAEDLVIEELTPEEFQTRLAEHHARLLVAEEARHLIERTGR